MVVLDRVFCLVDDPDGPVGRVKDLGLALDPGQAHMGQGTRNRRLFLRHQYFELLWVVDEAEARANPLRLDRRAATAEAGASPFGLGFRGRPEPNDDFWLYEDLGFPIWVHHDNERFPERPLVFVLDLPERAPVAVDVELLGVRVGRPSAPSLPAFDGPPVVHVPEPLSMELILRHDGTAMAVADGLIVRA